ncbi:Mov34-domain-containing protein [Cystobasidium minutum MCA 4210]|uniref:Mov34-domain-containing protein n=1 Tax=Cystobasidium minutum MCA 4210 TaxID=1397322 RepID=UPI0034CEF91D|eukprot:jgi/Rhomi1/159740/estExt_Genewise1Plus.C_3_t30024
MSKDPEVVLPDSAASNEGVQVSLHPLPLLNISEHYTRVRIQNGGSLANSDIKVMGALIGTQAGRELEVVNSFELAAVPNAETKEWNVNHDFFVTRQNQFKQVFPAFEFLGWYSVGHTPQASDLSIHTQLLAYNESPVFLQLHPDAIQPPSAPGGSTKVAASKLPLDIYESVVDTASGKSETKFVKVPTEAGGYKVETYEAERIAVETASRLTVSDATANASTAQGGKAPQETVESTLVAGLSTQRNAISMLHSRIAAILEYLSAVQQGKAAPDHETLRQISSLVSSITCSRGLQASNASTSDFKALASDAPVAAVESEFEQEQNDVTLTALLNLMTKSLDEANMLVDKFGIAYARDQSREDEMSGTGGRGVSHRKGGHPEFARRSGRRNVDSLF